MKLRRGWAGKPKTVIGRVSNIETGMKIFRDAMVLYGDDMYLIIPGHTLPYLNITDHTLLFWGGKEDLKWDLNGQGIC